ncbi:hypothetical protein OH764_34020 (plasmid) [Burkholderia sp. M6-3]
MESVNLPVIASVADASSASVSDQEAPIRRAAPGTSPAGSPVPALLANLPKRSLPTTSSQSAETLASWQRMQNPAAHHAFEKLPNELVQDIGGRLQGADLRNFSQVNSNTRHALSDEVWSLNLSTSARRVASSQDVSNVMSNISKLERPVLRIEPLSNLGGLWDLHPAARNAAFNSVMKVAASCDSSRKQLMTPLALSFAELNTPAERSQALDQLIEQVRQLPLDQQADMMGTIRVGISTIAPTERILLKGRIMQEEIRIHRASLGNRGHE